VLDLIQNTLVLFFAGKLFRDPLYVCRQLAIGASATTGLFLAMDLLLGSPIVAALLAGLLGGALQSLLFEDVKYR
jgi:hypothetical protein